MYYLSLLFVILIVIYPSNAHETLSPTSNRNCTLKYNKRLLKEGDEITIVTRLYKVEDCQLQRAYRTCGTHLWFIINIVCDAIDAHKGKSSTRTRYRRFTEEKSLSDSCCLNSCTVNEMTRYCP